MHTNATPSCAVTTIRSTNDTADAAGKVNVTLIPRHQSRPMRFTRISVCCLLMWFFAVSLFLLRLQPDQVVFI